MNRIQRTQATLMGSQLGCFLIVLAFNIVVGAWSVDYILSFFGKDIPIFADILIGLFVAQLSVPVAIAMWLLRLFGAL